MDQEISLSRVKLYLQNISLWNSAKNYSNFFFKLSTAVNPEEYFNTYQTYFQLFPTVKSALHAVRVVLTSARECVTRPQFSHAARSLINRSYLISYICLFSVSETTVIVVACFLSPV